MRANIYFLRADFMFRRHREEIFWEFHSSRLAVHSEIIKMYREIIKMYKDLMCQYRWLGMKREDFDEVFAPVARLDTVRMIIALAAQQG